MGLTCLRYACWGHKAQQPKTPGELLVRFNPLKIFQSTKRAYTVHARRMSPSPSRKTAATRASNTFRTLGGFAHQIDGEHCPQSRIRVIHHTPYPGSIRRIRWLCNSL